MDDAQYLQGNECKMKWYADNGFVEGENLFVTHETPASGIDSSVHEQTLAVIQVII